MRPNSRPVIHRRVPTSHRPRCCTRGSGGSSWRVWPGGHAGNDPSATDQTDPHRPIRPRVPYRPTPGRPTDPGLTGGAGSVASVPRTNRPGGCFFAGDSAARAGALVSLPGRTGAVRARHWQQGGALTDPSEVDPASLVVNAEIDDVAGLSAALVATVAAERPAREATTKADDLRTGQEHAPARHQSESLTTDTSIRTPAADRRIHRRGHLSTYADGNRASEGCRMTLTDPRSPSALRRPSRGVALML